VSEYPTAPLPVQQYPAPRRRRSRAWRYVLIALVLLLVLLVIADRVSVAYAENRMAQQIQSQGLSSKPHVSIEGFPFLTQVLARDLHNVNITASSVVTEGSLNINNLVAHLQGIHLNSSYNSGTVDHLSGTALISFGDLFGGQGGPSATVTAVHGNEVALKMDLDIVSGTAVARVTQVGTDKIHVQVISASGIPLSLLGPLADFTITVPNLPLNMDVQSVSVSGQGVLIHVTGSNIKFSQ
jgi:hypothetical protein